MGIGARFLEINCDLETASGGWARRRNRQRRRGSDELALFVAMHNSESGDLLAWHKYYRGNVDSGDTFRPERSMLAPVDSVDNIVITLTALEIDGAGKLSKLVDREYKNFQNRVTTLGGLSLPSISGPGPLDKTVGFLSPLGAGFWFAEMEDDLIAVDRFYINRDWISDMLNGGTLPEREGYSPITGRGIDVVSEYERRGDNLITNREYTSSAANSVYSMSFEFRAV